MKFYAYRILSQMTMNSMFFITSNADALERCISKIDTLFEQYLDSEAHCESAEDDWHTMEDYCNKNGIVLEWDGDDYDDDFTHEDDEYFYKNVPIKIIRTWSFRY